MPKPFYTTVQGRTTYVIDMTCDSKARLDTLTYPGASNRLAIKHLYNPRGYLTTVENAASGDGRTITWSALASYSSTLQVHYKHRNKKTCRR